MPKKQTYSPEQEQRVIETFKAGAGLTYKEIGELCGVREASVAYLGRKHGFIKVQPSKRGVDEVKSIRTLEDEIAELHAQIAEKQQLKERLSIRFDRDGDDVLVFGILGYDVPVTAPKSQWKRWLIQEGPVRLREFIEGMNGK